MMTGQADAQAIGNAVNEANLYRYIAKPWDEIDLILTVKEALRSFYQDRQLQQQNQELRELNALLEQKVVERTAELQAQVIALQEAQEEILGLNQKLEQLSYLDGLTGIANRRFFDITLTKEWDIACCKGASLGLLMIDVDFFKKYNDFYGHPQGDDCLKKVAQAINLVGRCRRDLAARYGGEEFALFLADVEINDAYQIADQLLEAIAALKIPHALSEVGEYVTISIGLYVDVPRQYQTVDDFIKEADLCLYQAKKQGRSQICGKPLRPLR
jgi:diguanylate cyclase (GGDEF)-like protein